MLGNPFQYRDARTDGMMEQGVRKASPQEKIFDATGIQFMQLNTLYQLLRDARDASRALLDVAETLLFMPDLFNYLFTGERKARVLDRDDQPDVRPARSSAGRRTLLEQLGPADAHPAGDRASGHGASARCATTSPRSAASAESR